jgi:hypothetical protein
METTADSLIEKTDVEGTAEAAPIAKPEAYKVTDGNELISRFLAPIGQMHVEPKEVVVGEETLEFSIRHLSFAETALLEGKKYRRLKNGQQVPLDAHLQETNSASWLLHTCVVKDTNEGKLDENKKPLAPDWVPLFSLDEVRDRILANSDPKADELIYGLMARCWEVNRALSPLQQAQALKQLTE